MEPNISSSRFESDKVPTQKEQGIESAQESLPSKGVPFEIEKNQTEKINELSSTGSHVLPPPVLPTPVVVTQQQVPDDNKSSLVLNAPSVAADDDLIEKEWVKKAKEIIADTHDNPRKRETEVSRLQRDYLKKRYRKEIGTR
jgi:hypothetical protein